MHYHYSTDYSSRGRKDLIIVTKIPFRDGANDELTWSSPD